MPLGKDSLQSVISRDTYQRKVISRPSGVTEWHIIIITYIKAEQIYASSFTLLL
jgi:hypothetical protein